MFTRPEAGLRPEDASDQQPQALPSGPGTARPAPGQVRRFPDPIVAGEEEFVRNFKILPWFGGAFAPLVVLSMALGTRSPYRTGRRTFGSAAAFERTRLLL